MLLAAKDILSHKQKLFDHQKGICPLCNRPLGAVNEMHLDHNHELTGLNEGRCRQLLHPNCNTLEGTSLHKFNRSGLKSSVEYLDYLENLIAYLKKDYSLNPKHPKWVPDKVKAFSRLTLAEMKAFVPHDFKTKKEYIAKYKKMLKEN